MSATSILCSYQAFDIKKERIIYEAIMHEKYIYSYQTNRTIHHSSFAVKNWRGVQHNSTTTPPPQK
jgi:hypothetical protein